MKLACYKYKSSCHLLTLMAGLLCCIGASAQRYPFHNLSVDDGLIQSQATCLAQDKTGNLWIGTLGGLSKYDGRNFTSYTIRNGLGNNMIWSLAADSAGNIWVGGNTDIAMFNGKTFVHYPKPIKQPAHSVNNTQQIVITGDTTWWRASGDLYYIAYGKISYFVTPGPAGFVSSVFAGADGLWIAKESVIYHTSKGRCDTVRFTLPEDQRAPLITRIFRSHDSMIWVTTNEGLFNIQNGHLVPKPIYLEELTVPPSISSITQDRSGALWLGTSKGVIRVNGNSYQLFNKQNGLRDNSFSDLFTDSEGNVWMASDGQGIFRYSGTQFSGLDESAGLPSDQVTALATNNSDSLFIGTYDAGLYIFKDGKIGSLSFPSSPVPAITSLCYTKGSKLWIATRGRGLWSYDHEIFRQYEAPDRNFPSNYVNRVYEDPDQRLWIGFANGAMLLEHDSFKTVNVKPEAVFSFLSIGKDSMLIAAESGLSLYSAGIVVDYKTKTVADSIKVQCFLLAGRNLWIGSSDNGIVRYNMDTHTSMLINKNNGLKSDFIYNIIADNDGSIWAGTGFGIHRIKVSESEAPQITFYGKAQGVTGMESNINAVLKLTDGSIWFGTTNGALHYQPRSTVVNSAPSSIVLQSVRLTDESAIDHSYYDSTDNWNGVPYNLRLPAQKNNIAFTFQAISLSGSQQVQYRYRMDGLEAPWSQWSSTNSVSYSALPPGRYVFHVQCQGAEAQNNPELVYAFEIITPFQKTMWFRISVLAACIIIGILLQYIATSRKQRRARLMTKLRSEEQAKIRLRTAEDFHDEIGNKLTRINVLTSVLKNKINLNPDTERILHQIEDNTGQLYSGTRDILWSLKPTNDSLYEILYRIRDFGNDLFQDTDIEFTFTGKDDKWSSYKLPMDMSRNLIMIFKEALNNCLKYSAARKVWLEVSFKSKGVLQMVLRDDGKGFDMQTIDKGNGINNMNVRAARLKGKLYIDSRFGKGTIISLTFRLPK